jgi:hypothetical protein
MSKRPDSHANLLLKTLSPEALKHAQAVDETHPVRTVLIEEDETPKHAYFPHWGAAASVVRATTAGQMVEAGVVGGEGLVHVQGILTTSGPTSSRGVRELFDEHPAFREAVLGYTSVFLDQVTQNLVCNRLHAIEQRLAKWLLVMQDRTRTDELHLTQEFLSYMLGVHRPGVSIAVTALEADGLIAHRRSRVKVRDPPA